LDIKTLETLFGRRHRQPTKKQQRAGRRGYEVTKEVDASSWEVTVWRVRWGSVLLKVYDQAGRVLRVEVKGLNTAGLGCGKGLGKLGEQLGCVQGKGLVERVAGRRRYECRPQQLRVLCGYVVLREQVIKPVLAGLAHQELPPPPPKLGALDQRYLTLRPELQRTCHTLGLAA
jgi:hypothetical protein